MFKSNILAHRGLWKARNETNSLSAIKGAMESGFGIETDVRDLNGELVISHDPPKTDCLLSLKFFFELYVEAGTSSRIALNIKADGLSTPIKNLLDNEMLNKHNFYVFDMSLPDTLTYKNISLPFYIRFSEYESESVLLKTAAGAWVDNFTGDFEQVIFAKEVLNLGKRVGFVSPELHGRPHLPIWEEIKKFELHRNRFFELCTDFPEAAFDFFGEKK